MKSIRLALLHWTTKGKYKKEGVVGRSAFLLHCWLLFLVCVFAIVVGEPDVLVPTGILPGRCRPYGNAAANCFN